MKYSRFIKILRKNFPNLWVQWLTYRSMEVAAWKRYNDHIFSCFLVNIYFYSYRKIKITCNLFNGTETFYIKSKDFYKVLQVINETFINAKNKFDIVSS